LLPAADKKKALPKSKKKSEKEKVESLREAFKQEREKSHDYLKQLTYLQADFENFKKRIQKEHENNIFRIKEPLLRNLLSITDELEIALSESEKAKSQEAIIEGLQMILNKMRLLLKNQGLRKIETAGKRFDPKYHEAVAEVKNKDKEPGDIIEEIRTGYIYKDEVFRPSLVKIVTQKKKVNS
jgi:molecular chaperone GrpE